MAIVAGICVLLLPYLLYVNGQSPPEIVHISDTQIIDVRSKLELACTVKSANDYPVLWGKFDRSKSQELLPISTGTALLIPDSRFTVRYDATNATYTLQIKDVQRPDEGLYQCSVLISRTNNVSAEVDVQIRRPPVIFNNSTQKIVTRDGKENIELVCYVDGYPQPQVSWRRELNEILPTGGVVYEGHRLLIPKIMKEHRGKYYCVADNGFGQGVKHFVDVMVEFTPILTTPKARVGQALQYEQELECEILANPLPSIRWIKDGIQLYTDHHFSILHFVTSDDVTQSIIRIKAIAKRDYGNYVCQTTNRVGTTDLTVELFETPDPVCPPACSTTPVENATQITTSIVGDKLNTTTQAPEQVEFKL